MDATLNRLVAEFKIAITKETDVKALYNSLYSMRQFIGDYWLKQHGEDLEFINNPDKITYQVAQILNGDWHNLDLTLISAEDDAALQVLNNEIRNNNPSTA
jgi:hypothetical protein